ncbi:hypothetical protein F2Q70_00009092 [Brassica cretica]|uniref:Uncharacterized protein n=1 Tax=Brassica cretica TaxID=69181 RepID=A0A8S9M8X0_BRACR|nr:hypothetical protein F2Q70_00009092 [Brassica cretica]
MCRLHLESIDQGTHGINSSKYLDLQGCKREIDVINVSIKPIKQLISPAYCGRLRYYPPDLSAISNIAYISSFEALMILPSSACVLPSSSLYTPYSSDCMTRIFLFEGIECESRSSVGSNHSPNCRSTLLEIVYLIHKSLLRIFIGLGVIWRKLMILENFGDIWSKHPR